MTGKELEYISAAHSAAHLSGDGMFTKRCHEWIESNMHCKKALLTHSCTAALEMSALLLNLKEGDEIIMPSYTFVSTANAFVLRGAVPVFVDIRPDTLNLDESLIEEAITPRTKAIVPVHYAGVSCEMDTITEIAKRHNLVVIEDAAQGVMSFYKDKALGSIGHLGCFSFHETKNVISGEGGALLINDASYVSQAEIVREKGTDRNRFFRGEVDKYTWQSIGSSYLPSELIAAFLMAQLEQAEKLTQERLKIWDFYHSLLESAELAGVLRRPIIPEECIHNAHMYYILVPKSVSRNEVLTHLKSKGIGAVFHYVPLHTSPAGERYCRVHGKMNNTLELSECVIRLPLWLGLTYEQQAYVVSELKNCLYIK